MKEDSRINWLQLTFRYGIYIIFVLVYASFALMSKNFLSTRNILNILQQSVPIGIATVGIVFVLLTAGIDISIGAVMFCSGVFTALILANGVKYFKALDWGVPDWGVVLLAVGAATLAGMAWGAVNGLVITRWKIVPFITTLAVMGLARGVGLLTGGTQTVFIGSLGKFISTSKILNVHVIVIIMLLVMALGHLALSRTVFGRQLYAVGNDPRAATKIGIKTNRIIFTVYVVSGGLAGLAGAISGAQVGAVTVNFATGNEFLAISAAVLGGVSFFGGKGRIIPGALAGVLLIHGILNGLTFMNASHYAYAIYRSLIIFVAVLVDSVNNRGDIR